MQFRFATEHGRTFHFHQIYLETIEGVLELLETHGYRILRIHDDTSDYESFAEMQSQTGRTSRRLTIIATAEGEGHHDLIELHYRDGDLLVTRSDRSGRSDEAWDVLISYLEQRHRTVEDPFLRGYMVLILGLLGALPFLAMALYDIINWNLFVGLTILGVLSITGAIYILSVRPRQARIVYRRRSELGFFERYGQWIIGAVFAGFLSFIIMMAVEALLK